LSESVSQPRSARRRDHLDAGFYFAGTLFQRVSLFLALPFLLRSLSTAEYGAFGLLQSAMNLLPAILTLNIPAAVTRLYFDGATPSERRTIVTKLSALSAGLGLLAGFLVWISVAVFRARVANLLGMPESEAVFATTLVLIGVLGSNHLQVAWGIWRAENRAAHTATANALSGLLFLAAIGVLAATNQLGAASAIGAYACATALIGLSANAVAVAGNPMWGGTSSSPLAREALRYGLPVLPYLLALWGLGAGGRWIARATLTLEDTGRFTLASQLATMIGLVGRSAYEAWAPRSFEMIADGRFEEARGYLRARGRLTLAVVAILGGVTAMGIAFALPKFAPAYAGVALLFPLMALAPLFDVACMANHTELMGRKITGPIASYTVISILLFVASGLVGARLLGLWGLVGAYVLAYACQWILAGRAIEQVRRRSAEFEKARSGAGTLHDPSLPD